MTITTRDQITVRRLSFVATHLAAILSVTPISCERLCRLAFDHAMAGGLPNTEYFGDVRSSQARKERFKAFFFRHKSELFNEVLPHDFEIQVAYKPGEPGVKRARDAGDVKTTVAHKDNVADAVIEGREANRKHGRVLLGARVSAYQLPSGQRQLK